MLSCYLKIQEDAKNLKYLDFVQVAALYAVVCFSTIYEYAKDNSGPLKPGVQTVEATVKTVIGPVYDNLHDVPFEFLYFVDRKVHIILSFFPSNTCIYVCFQICLHTWCYNWYLDNISLQ